MTEKDLIVKYPGIFRLTNEDTPEPISLFGIEAPEGWYNLIDRLCSELEPYGVTCHQCKQKFGGLRFYVKYNRKEDYKQVNQIISKYEELSEITCEVCGEFGGIKNDNGWLTVLCDDHIK